MPTANSCRTCPYNNICHFWFITGQAQVLLVYGFSLHPYKARAAQESNLTASASRCTRTTTAHWLRGLDLNQRPSGYEPDELPGCSTPLYYWAGVLTLLGRHSTFQPVTTTKRCHCPNICAYASRCTVDKHEPGIPNLAGEHDAFAANADVWLERPSSQDAIRRWFASLTWWAGVDLND